jgi:hypothetical protein
MKKFVLTTKSESGDDYLYFLSSDEKPSNKTIDEWLQKNGSDVYEGQCYEDIEMLVEIPEDWIEFKKI